MWQAATSIVLIFAQLAVLVAAPAYICTAADGTQRLEWGDCDCTDDHDHAGQAKESMRRSVPPLHAPHVGDAPCHCEHQPLGSELRLLSRAEPDTRGWLLAVPHCCEKAVLSYRSVSARTIDGAPRGHTPLSDRLSICLRC
jgi:hypothetical protein